ncbi:MAG: ATP phosphoribosyltransferase [Oscillospiraceae bacterium]|nr:ATP phosphoribosyltransferase [Oscillospiraceae bacterium]
MDTPIRIALAKGRLEKQCRALFARAGYDCSALENPGRRLIHTLPNGAGLAPLEAVLAKAPDVVTYVSRGVCGLGVAGKDTVMEQGGPFYETLDLKLGACRFALAAPEGTVFFGGAGHKRVATKFPNITRRFLSELGVDAEIIRIEGSCELAPLLGLADAIVDIVETGATLRENGLAVLRELFPLSARLIVNVAAYKLRRAEIDRLTERLRESLPPSLTGENKA